MTLDMATARKLLSQATQTLVAERLCPLIETRTGYWVGAVVVPDRVAALGVPAFIDGRLQARGSHLRFWASRDAKVAKTHLRAAAFDDQCRHPSWLDLSLVPADQVRAALADLAGDDGFVARLARNHSCALIIGVPAAIETLVDAPSTFGIEMVLDIDGTGCSTTASAQSEASQANSSGMHADASASHPRTEDELVLHDLESLKAAVKHEHPDPSTTRIAAELLPRMRTTFGTAHPFARQARQAWRQCMFRDGDHAGVVAVLEEELDVTRWVTGSNSLLSIQTARSLGGAYQRAGRSPQAVVLLSDTVSRSVEHLGQEHEQTLLATLDLGIFLRLTNDPARALQHVEAAIAGLDHTTGHETPIALVARGELASIQTALDQHVAAAETLQTVVSIAEHTLGDSDRRTDAWRMQLGFVHTRNGQHRQAAELYERCLAHHRRASGATHPHTVMLMSLAGTERVLSGNPLAGARLLEEALNRIDAGVLAPPDLARRWLAEAHLKAEKPNLAIALLEPLLAEAEDDDNQATVQDRRNLAKAYRATGRIPEALHHYEWLVANRERLLGPNNIETVSMRWKLATTLMIAHRPGDAIAEYERALPELQRIHGPQHEETLSLQTHLARAYELDGQHENAVRTYRLALAGSERVLGPEHRNSRVARHHLTTLLRQRANDRPRR
jgi:tetratricopeptide (TPR) repeat protein